jgi:hypothetical protein
MGDPLHIRDTEGETTLVIDQAAPACPVVFGIDDREGRVISVNVAVDDLDTLISRLEFFREMSK